jgi:hypothetical protein
MSQENKKNLTGYVLNTLTNQEEKTMDANLNQDPSLRQKVEELQQIKEHISEKLHQTLAGIDPPPSLSFEGIAPQLETPAKAGRSGVFQRTALHLTTAILGIILIALGIAASAVFPTVLQPVILSQPLEMSLILPILSTLFLLISPVMSVQDAPTAQQKSYLTILLTLLLWIGQSMIWLMNIYLLQELTVKVVYTFSSNFDTAMLTKIISLFLLSLVWLSLVVISGEYHFKRLGRPASWKSFGWTLILSGIILALEYLFLQL